MKQMLEELGYLENEPDVVGYVLFHTEKRAFVALFPEPSANIIPYTGNVKEAYIADTRFEALTEISHLLVSDAYDLAIVPLINNPLLGLSVKPGFLDKK
ncbi:hypothetical protein [Photorhabdus heterorhabditis]|uniref:hypothetical protein n=1 Tax=Photorhabdus heterorhabditis TaxID=880156 RepID=UPI001562C656|nr:hypothetical protein [Photorhabdus heterorhabditis]NRN26775.1 hypothetical protein [Photorhabdus heterorhabditis subsp. aluminescens]